MNLSYSQPIHDSPASLVIAVELAVSWAVEIRQGPRYLPEMRLACPGHDVHLVSFANLRHVYRLAEILTSSDFEAYPLVLSHARLAQEEIRHGVPK
jgi:hypothetical protein